MTPKKRAVRTLLQALAAVCVAIPTAVALLPISTELAAQVTGWAAGLVVVASAVQNAIEAKADARRTPEG
jgi:hypothetical protein